MSLLNQYLKKIGEEESKAVTETPLPPSLRGQQRSYNGEGKYKIIVLVIIPAVLIGLAAWQFIILKPHKGISPGVAQVGSGTVDEKNQKTTTLNMARAEQIKMSSGHREPNAAIAESSMPPVTVESLPPSDFENRDIGSNKNKNSVISGVRTGPNSEKIMTPAPLKSVVVSGNASPVDEEKTELGQMVIEKHTEKTQPETTQPTRYRIPAPQVVTTFRQDASPLPPREIAQNYYQLGLSALQGGDLTEAAKYFRDMLKITPNDIDGLLNISNVYIRQDRLDLAVEVLEKIRKLDAANYKSLDNLGFVAIRRGNKEDAEKYFNKALVLNPSDEIALGNLAYIAQTENNQAEAAKYYDKLISINPLNVDALINYAHLMSQMKRFNRAIELYTKCLAIKSVQEDRELAQKIRQRIKLMSGYN